MILVDKDIKNRINTTEPLISNFNPSNLGAISYDLTIDCIIRGITKHSSYDLAPGSYVYIKAKEQLSMPNDLIGRVEEKNSRMRMGLVVSGPTYQPGHKTAIFLRVQNISDDIITINKDKTIAQIVFEKLTSAPETPYNQVANASYNNEYEYLAFGNYETEYKADIKEYKKVKENLEEKETQIYANILTFVGILMGIFSIVTLNLEAFAKTNITTRYIIVMNLSITLAIELLMSTILIFVNNNIKIGKIVTCIIILLSTIGMLYYAIKF